MYRKGISAPGGGIEGSETLEEAAYREIGEELGINNSLLELIGHSINPIYLKFKTKKLTRDSIEYDGMERYFFGFKFVGDNNNIKLQEAEIRSFKWVKYEDLKDFLLFDGQLQDTEKKIEEINNINVII